MKHLKDWYKEEKEKLETMPMSEKIQYILNYYWLWILGTCTAVFLVIFLITHMIQGAPDYKMYVIFANTLNNGGNDSKLHQDFMDYAKIDQDELVEFNSQIYFSYDVHLSNADHYYTTFVVLVETGTLDLITMTRDDIIALGNSGRLMDLDNPEMAALKNIYADRLIYGNYLLEDGEHRIPVGIDISDSKLIKEYGLYNKDCAIGISSNEPDLDMVMKFLEFVLEGSE